MIRFFFRDYSLYSVAPNDDAIDLFWNYFKLLSIKNLVTNESFGMMNVTEKYEGKKKEQITEKLLLKINSLMNGKNDDEI